MDYKLSITQFLYKEMLKELIVKKRPGNNIPSSPIFPQVINVIKIMLVIMSPSIVKMLVMYFKLFIC